MKPTFVGWVVDEAERAALLARFPPKYPEVVADHVTLKFPATRPQLPKKTTGQIVGEADDGAGVQALVVSIGGTTDRPDGSTYHMTWSLGRGREAKESNDVIRERGWRAFAAPVPVRLKPHFFKR